MEIKITKKIDSNYLSECLANWNLKSKKDIKAILTSFVFGFYLLFMAFVLKSRYSTFWNIWSSLGFAYVFIGLMLLYSLLRKKSKFISRIRACMKTSAVIEYTFSESLITIRDVESYGEFSWTLFSKYARYKDYLFLYLRNSELSSIVINRNDLENDSFTKLFELINSKLAKNK